VLTDANLGDLAVLIKNANFTPEEMARLAEEPAFREVLAKIDASNPACGNAGMVSNAGSSSTLTNTLNAEPTTTNGSTTNGSIHPTNSVHHSTNASAVQSTVTRGGADEREEIGSNRSGNAAFSLLANLLGDHSPFSQQALTPVSREGPVSAGVSSREGLGAAVPSQNISPRDDAVNHQKNNVGARDAASGPASGPAAKLHRSTSGRSTAAAAAAATAAPAGAVAAAPAGPGKPAQLSVPPGLSVGASRSVSSGSSSSSTAQNPLSVLNQALTAAARAGNLTQGGPQNGANGGSIGEQQGANGEANAGGEVPTGMMGNVNVDPTMILALLTSLRNISPSAVSDLCSAFGLQLSDQSFSNAPSVAALRDQLSSLLLEQGAQQSRERKLATQGWQVAQPRDARNLRTACVNSASSGSARGASVRGESVNGGSASARPGGSGEGRQVPNLGSLSDYKIRSAGPLKGTESVASSRGSGGGSGSSSRGSGYYGAACVPTLASEKGLKGAALKHTLKGYDRTGAVVKGVPNGATNGANGVKGPNGNFLGVNGHLQSGSGSLLGSSVSSAERFARESTDSGGPNGVSPPAVGAAPPVLPGAVPGGVPGAVPGRRNLSSGNGVANTYLCGPPPGLESGPGSSQESVGVNGLYPPFGTALDRERREPGVSNGHYESLHSDFMYPDFSATQPSSSSKGSPSPFGGAVHSPYSVGPQSDRCSGQSVPLPGLNPRDYFGLQAGDATRVAAELGFQKGFNNPAAAAAVGGPGAPVPHGPGAPVSHGPWAGGYGPSYAPSYGPPDAASYGPPRGGPAGYHSPLPDYPVYDKFGGGFRGAPHPLTDVRALGPSAVKGYPPTVFLLSS